jgi:hypothetical protein
MRRALPLLVALASLAATGCGGDEGSETVTVTAPASSTTASGGTTSPTSTAPSGGAAPSTATAPSGGAAAPSTASSSPEALPPTPPQPSSGAPRGTLKVAADGCDVLRSAFATEPDTLQWSVRDEGGFEVLGRNARGETRYRYYRPGEYTVVLQAFVDGKYAPISNVVSIRC